MLSFIAIEVHSASAISANSNLYFDMVAWMNSLNSFYETRILKLFGMHIMQIEYYHERIETIQS